MRRDGSPSSLREALPAGWRELALYVVVGASYVAIGVAVPEFLFSYVVALGFLLVWVIALPYLARRLGGVRRR